MTSRSRFPGRRLFAATAAASLLLLLASTVPPALVLFAGFDPVLPPPPSGGAPLVQVEGGEAAFLGPAVFDLVSEGDNGRLRVGDNPYAQDAVFDCRPDAPIVGNAIDIGFLLQCTTAGDLVFRAEDDNGGQVIDVTVEEDGDVKVRAGGITTTVPLAPGMAGQELTVKLLLRAPGFLPPTWQLQISVGAQTVKASGALVAPNQVRLGGLQLVRPLGKTGTALFDDLWVTAGGVYSSLQNNARYY